MSRNAWSRFSEEGDNTYQIIYPGYKYNLTDVNAAVGLHQIKRIEKVINIRKNYAKLYFEAFEDYELIELPPDKKDRKNVWYLFPILLKLENFNISRIDFIRALHKENIGSGIHYIAIHQQLFYQKTYGFKKNTFPRAEYVSERTVSIPLQTSMSEDDIFDVITAVKKILNYYKKS